MPVRLYNNKSAVMSVRSYEYYELIIDNRFLMVKSGIPLSIISDGVEHEFAVSGWFLPKPYSHRYTTPHTRASNTVYFKLKEAFSIDTEIPHDEFFQKDKYPSITNYLICFDTQEKALDYILKCTIHQEL